MLPVVDDTDWSAVKFQVTDAGVCAWRSGVHWPSPAMSREIIRPFILISSFDKFHAVRVFVALP